MPNTANAVPSNTGLTLVINPYTGGLAISVPGTAVFTPMISPEFPTNVTLTLGTITVTDTRRAIGALGSWVTSASSTDLISGTDSLTATTFGYSSGLFVKSGGTALMTENTRVSMDSATAVATTTSVTGNHIITWTPTMTIPVPASKTSGTYLGTLTHSVL
jgi:hypothetical protein